MDKTHIKEVKLNTYMYNLAALLPSLCVEIENTLVRHQSKYVYRDNYAEVLAAGRSGVNSGELKSLANEIKVVNQRTQGLECGCKMFRSLGLSRS